MKIKKQNFFRYIIHYKTVEDTGNVLISTHKKITPVRRRRLEDELEEKLNKKSKLVITNIEWINKIS